MGWIADLLKEIPSAARYKSELETMEKSLAECQLAKKQLESENVNLRQEIQRRDDVIQTEKSHGSRLDEVREKILLTVAQNEDATTQKIAQISGVTELIAEFHLEELRKPKMVSASYTAGFSLTGDSGSSNWSVSQLGLSYLINHELIA
jgi:predicted HTH transcriptional regulator